MQASFDASDGAVAAAELSTTRYASTGVDDMTTEIESLALASKLYSRAKLAARCGAPQSVVVSESVTGVFSVIGTAMQSCTTNSTGTRPGLPAAFSAVTTTVSRYTPVASPAGLKASRSLAVAVPLFGPTNASHASPIASRAVHDSVPGPWLVTARLSPPIAVLPTAAESSTLLGASASVARGGGVLVSLSTWQVVSRIRRGRRTATRTAPTPGPRVRGLRHPPTVHKPPTTSP